MSLEISENYDLVILYSGGADSRLLLEFAKKTGMEPYCLLVDYGQLHKEELEFAKKQLQKDNIKYQTVTVSGLNVNSALTGSGEKGTYEGVSEWHVPGRNSIFLSLALSVAENKNIDKIWIGCDWSDRHGLFVDCYQDYIFEFDKLLKICGSKNISLEAPLLGISKQMVLSLLNSFGISKNDIFSGYGNL